MAKIRLGKTLPTMALPIGILGANCEGKANFCTVAWLTIIDDEPPTIGLVLGKKRRTVDGARENGTFSVCFPSTALAAETDYVGMHSGYKTDKSEVFDVFYGELGTAPLIKECPLAMECVLKEIKGFEGTDLLVGEVAEVHADESCLVKGKPNLVRLDPLLYSMPGGPYFGIGGKVADAFKVGKGLKPRKAERN